MRRHNFLRVGIKHLRFLPVSLVSLCCSFGLIAQNLEVESVKKEGYNRVTGVSTFSPLNNLTYIQQTLDTQHFALGHFKVLSNAVTLEPFANLQLTATGGTVEQQSFFSPLPPNIHLYYRAEISYAISNYLQPYMYTQHLSSPINQNPGIDNDNLRLNPFFMQSEIGTGIKTEVKGYYIETGVRTMTNPTLDSQTSQTQVFSKLSTRF